MPSTWRQHLPVSYTPRMAARPCRVPWRKRGTLSLRRSRDLRSLVLKSIAVQQRTSSTKLVERRFHRRTKRRQTERIPAKCDLGSELTLPLSVCRNEGCWWRRSTLRIPCLILKIGTASDDPAFADNLRSEFALFLDRQVVRALTARRIRHARDCRRSAPRFLPTRA